MKQVSFKFEVVTPMFLGGASPNGEAELRPPSIKGLLRWWFRAVGGDKKWEEEIFGASGIQVRRKSPFRISVDGIVYGRWEFDRNAYRKFDKPGKCRSKGVKVNGIVYAGYSLNLGSNSRKAISSDTRFSVSCSFAPVMGEDEIDLILSLFWLLGHLGGLGTRWRRGFGSLQLLGEEHSSIYAETPEEWRERFLEKWSDVKNKLKKFTGASPAGVWFLSSLYVWKKSFPSWEEALNDIASAMQVFRQCRNPDHDDVYSFLAHRRPLVLAPERTAFGMPLTFRFRGLQKSVTFRPEWHSRMASPLIFHIAKLRKGRYLPVLVKLKGKFLEKGEGISVDKYRINLSKPGETLDGEEGDTILKDFLQQVVRPLAVEVSL